MKVRLSIEDQMFRAAALVFVWIVIAATLYPFIYVLSSSISDPKAVFQNKVFFWPIGFSLEAYKVIFKYEAVRTGFMNTVFYTVVGTAVNMLLTSLMAYPLSRKGLFARKYFLMMVTFTMIFGGGLIPLFLVIKSLGMLDTRWALIIPAAVSTWNLILLKTFFENIPKELEEAATVDGATAVQTLFRIMIPISLPAMATISLFYAVGHWNSFFPALIYLTNEHLYPIQLFLRNIVIASETAALMDNSGSMAADQLMMSESIKFATIISVALPIISVYPFIQKYFVKGAMIGSIKG